MSYNYDFEKQQEKEIKELEKHIYAILRVGKEFAMDREDIRFALEVHDKAPKFSQYMFNKAMMNLYDRTLHYRDGFNELFYIRKPPEKQQNYFWY